MAKKRQDDAEVVCNVAEQLRPFLVPVNELTPDPANARTHGVRNVAAIAASMKRFGQDQLLVVQKSGMVVRKGNGRLEAALRLGWTHVAAIVVDEGSVEATARALADNRASDLASWNDAVLGQLLRSLEKDGAEVFDLGWSADELRLAMASANGSTVGSDAEAPERFKEVDEKIETEFRCPKCSYEWSGKPK